MIKLFITSVLIAFSGVTYSAENAEVSDQLKDPLLYNYLKAKAIKNAFSDAIRASKNKHRTKHKIVRAEFVGLSKAARPTYGFELGGDYFYSNWDVEYIEIYDPVENLLLNAIKYAIDYSDSDFDIIKTSKTSNLYDDYTKKSLVSKSYNVGLARKHSYFNNQDFLTKIDEFYVACGTRCASYLNVLSDTHFDGIKRLAFFNAAIDAYETGTLTTTLEESDVLKTSTTVELMPEYMLKGEKGRYSKFYFKATSPNP
ncbi:hypothetical protein N7340_18515 [Comamonas aquatica]|uniref:hypothetical protein n=1 Tax=Comamonas aquatica TaxID=225991 RepID=UPI002447C0A4|nr:hypothetical protein [Comamonas aquatica]MDH0373721.1 hypothetical protein [Comamonas aquatica]